jgi:hypothetical protein
VATKMMQTTDKWFKNHKKSAIQKQNSMNEPILSKYESDELNGDNLDEWQRKTCRSKWCYKVVRDDDA